MFLTHSLVSSSSVAIVQVTIFCLDYNNSIQTLAYVHSFSKIYSPCCVNVTLIKGKSKHVTAQIKISKAYIAFKINHYQN